MIWLTLRQFRTQAAVIFGGLATLSIYGIVSGLQLRNLYPSDWSTTCDAAGTCDTISRSIRDFDTVFQTLSDKLFLLLLPAITGIFWGAPLVARELESGTHRLAWTQSISRTRWFASKIATVGLGSIAATAVLSLVVTWWFRPIDAIGTPRFDPAVFSLRDIVPLGYAAFAFALGVTAGLLIRRTLPAMATTLITYAAIRIIVQTWIRPHFRTPLHASAAFQPAPKPHPGSSVAPFPKSDVFSRGNLTGNVHLTKPGDWIVTDKVIDPAGHIANQIFTPTDPCMINNTCFTAIDTSSPTSPPTATGPSSYTKPHSSSAPQSSCSASASGGSATDKHDTPAPVLAGAGVRARMTVSSVEAITDGDQATISVAVDCDGIESRFA